MMIKKLFNWFGYIEPLGITKMSLAEVVPEVAQEVQIAYLSSIMT